MRIVQSGAEKEDLLGAKPPDTETGVAKRSGPDEDVPLI
jgi:hypothetical protein